MEITWLTRRKSFEEIKPNRKVRYEQILEILCMGNKTAKKTCKYTGKTVTVYKITKLGFEAINNKDIHKKS
jgi:hypothetical protein